MLFWVVCLTEWTSFVWKAKRYKVYSEKCLFWHCCLQLLFIYKAVPQISFFFLLGTWKALSKLQLTFRSWFRRHDVRFSPQDLNFKTLRHCFVDKRAMITTLIFSWLVENPCIFCLWKKKDLNKHWIITKSYKNMQICHPKQL